jgi:hypothetical protein
MKLKYILSSLLALVLGTAFTGCSEDFEPTYLSEVKVSSSFVSFPAAGSTVTIDLQATGAWAFDESRIPEWLTISPMSGDASVKQISFTAGVATESRGATVLLTVFRDGKVPISQRINVQQVTAKVELPISPISAVIANPDGNYRVKGVCVSNPDNQYGNWNIQDETGTLYIYGTLDKKGNKGAYPISGTNGWGFTVGDVITIEGPATVYGSTIEMVDVTVISIQKSLIKIEEGETAAFDANGGDFMVRYSYTGDVPSITVAEDAKSWIGISSIEQTDSTTNVIFHVAPNTEEAARTGVIEFTSKSGSTSSTLTSTVSQMGLSGTLTNPFTVADAIAYCKSLTGATANDFYVKGKISKIDNNGQFGSFGNATFYISDDGEYHGTVTDDETKKLVPDTELDFEAYRVLFFNNEKWTEGHANISEGDEVIICGKLTLYKGIAETSGNKAYIYSLNGVTTDENGVGSLEAPFNSAGAKAAIDNGVSSDVFVKGKVSSIVSQFSAQYGNATFWISDDGTAEEFEAYRVLWLGNQKWVEGNDPIAVGDEVLLRGKLTKYGSTYETSSGKAYIYSVNGKTE